MGNLCIRRSLKRREIIIEDTNSFHKNEQEKERLYHWVNANTINQIQSLQNLSSVAIARKIKNIESIDNLPLFQHLKECILAKLSPVFDQKIIQDYLEFLNNGKTVKYTGKGYSSAILLLPLQIGFKSGRHAWIFKIERSRVAGWLQIGVINEERKKDNLKTVWDGNPHPFRRGEMAQRNNGNFHSGIKPEESCMNSGNIFSCVYTTGDYISVCLDVDAREISWFKNSEPYGSIMTINGNEFWPSVSLDSPLEEVSILALYSSINSF